MENYCIDDDLSHLTSAQMKALFESMLRAYNIQIDDDLSRLLTSAQMKAILEFMLRSRNIQIVACKESEPPSRFSKQILEATTHYKYKKPIITFSGKEDPVEHLEIFRAWWELQNVSQEYMCVAFQWTLTGYAWTWFTCLLEPMSIKSFTQLSQLFIQQFPSIDDYSFESPFTGKVLEAPLPRRFKMNNLIKVYSGEGDPTEHLGVFCSWMDLYAPSRAVMCRAFSLTLTGAAREWFRTLRPGSIGSFTQLSILFIYHFAGAADYTAKSPFTRQVLEAPLPSNFDMYNHVDYSGEGDPKLHVLRFKVVTQFSDFQDAIMCRAFQFTLKGAALKWFRRLKPKSIASFNQLSELFTSEFWSSIHETKPATYMFSVKQRKDEPLRDFVWRFKTQAVLVERDELVFMRALISAIKSNVRERLENKALYKSLQMNLPSSYSELLNRVVTYSTYEEEVLQLDRN